MSCMLCVPLFLLTFASAIKREHIGVFSSGNESRL